MSTFTARLIQNDGLMGLGKSRVERDEWITGALKCGIDSRREGAHAAATSLRGTRAENSKFCGCVTCSQRASKVAVIAYT